MSILSTLNKLTGKKDKNVLAALNSLTGKTADDIEEAIGNLDGSGGGGSDSEKRMVPIYLTWDEDLNSTGQTFTQDQIDTILGRGIQSTYFDDDGDECTWPIEKVEPGLFRTWFPTGVNVSLLYTDQPSFDSVLKNIDIVVGGGHSEPTIRNWDPPTLFDIIPIYTNPGNPSDYVFVVPDRQQVTLFIGARTPSQVSTNY